MNNSESKALDEAYQAMMMRLKAKEWGLDVRIRRIKQAIEDSNKGSTDNE